MPLARLEGGCRKPCTGCLWKRLLFSVLVVVLLDISEDKLWSNIECFK
jgi:hypothetical protein